MGAICGIDWASDWHDVHIADQQGGVLAAEQFAHDERGISALIALLPPARRRVRTFGPQEATDRCLLP